MEIKMEKEPVTPEGLEKLKKKLKELKSIKRPKIINAIAEARSHGDLKENAEYHAAKEEQSKIEGRIIEINDLIARANVVDVTKVEKKDSVIFVSTVHLINLENNKNEIYKIVGKDEADLKKNYIYFRSPIGKALIGKKNKELLTVSTPSGERNFEITDIKYL
jgi:transcription elongation factor GreA